MNEQPTMKLMFKGYQGDFPGKSFCKLSRRRKCKNEQSAITLPCLPVFFVQYNLCPSWVQVRINFCSNWAEVEFGTSTQLGWRCVGFYSQVGNNFARILWALQIGRLWEADPFPTFQDLPSGNLCKFSLLGEHHQSPLNATCGVGCAFILNTSIYWLLRNLHRSSISHKRKMKIQDKLSLNIFWRVTIHFPTNWPQDNAAAFWKSTSSQVGTKCFSASCTKIRREDFAL